MTFSHTFYNSGLWAYAWPVLICGNPEGSWLRIFFYIGISFASIRSPGALSTTKQYNFCWFLRPWELYKFKPKLIEFSGETFSSPSRTKANTNNCPCSLSLVETVYFFKPAYYWGWSALRGLTLPGESHFLCPIFPKPKALFADPQVVPRSFF